MTPTTEEMRQMIAQASKCCLCGERESLKNDCVCGACVSQRQGWALRKPVSEVRAK